MSLTGATGPAPIPESSGILEALATTSNQRLFAGLSDGEPKMLAGRLENQRRAPATKIGIAPIISFPSGERIETGIGAAAAPQQPQGERIRPNTAGTAVTDPADQSIGDVPIPPAVKIAAGLAAALHAQTYPKAQLAAQPDRSVEETNEGTDGDLRCRAKIDRIIGFADRNGPADSASPGSNKSAAGAPQRQLLRGGTYTAQQVIALLNAYYLVGKSEQEVAIFRIRDDGLLTFTSNEQFKLDVANIFVEIPDSVRTPGVPTSKGVTKGTKFAAADQYWMKSDLRNEKRIIFNPDPKYCPKPDEFNLWRGFGVEPRKGWQKQRRLLRHIRKVICRRDKAKFKYLIRSLAWAVQNPDKQWEIFIVLKSPREGTGKSTLGKVMLRIFGRHGALVEDKERLLGRFNAWQEPISFIVAEEILWAGDRKTADQLKSRVTADTFQIEHKQGATREIPNRLHLLVLTNHDHAVSAGVGARRPVVYDISDEHACDKMWFDPLYRDLANGGYEEFLWFLQHIKVGNWHPRQVLRTAETVEQQRMSADSITQWAQACIAADMIIGAGLYGLDSELGAVVAFKTLEQSYTDFCQRRRLRPVGNFGSPCTEMFGPRIHMPAQQAGPSAGKRPWGYQVPSGDEWQEKIDARLGIRK